jgi:hypothetical protein
MWAKNLLVINKLILQKIEDKTIFFDFLGKYFVTLRIRKCIIKNELGMFIVLFSVDSE